MTIKTVTITGADDLTKVSDLVVLNNAYPFVEWGILVAEEFFGAPRFPSMETIDKIVRQMNSKTNFSLHVCGDWVERICFGDDQWLSSFKNETRWAFKRMQLNFHGLVHEFKPDFFKCIERLNNLGVQVIFQVDGVNDHGLKECQKRKLNVVPLFDVSHGAGVIPESWPEAQAGVYTGFAGGLSPENLEGELRRIESSCQPNSKIWIDMETRVRNSQTLDHDKIKKVLEISSGKCFYNL